MLTCAAAPVERGPLARKRQSLHRKSETARKLGRSTLGGNAISQQMYDPFGNSVLSTLACLVGVLVVLQAYVFPGMIVQ
jgi:hypothetical protein